MLNLSDVISDDTFLFNLLLTEFCPFECSHCFYHSGPGMPSTYMDNELMGLIDKNISLVNELQGLDGYGNIDINYIGGEPFTNVKKFGELSDRWFTLWAQDHSFQLTTNGFWLEKPKSAAKVFKEMRKLWNYSHQEFPVFRISNDQFHLPFFRNKNAGKDYLKHLLYEYTEGYMYCECGNEYVYDEEYDEDTCNDCGSYYPLVVDEEMLYIDTFTETYIPTGRAADELGYSNTGYTICIAGNPTTCVTIKPTGTLTDFCSKGSEFGDILNIKNTTVLHAMHCFNKFLAFCPSFDCNNCNSETEYYVQNYADEIREIASNPLVLTFDEGVVTVYTDGSYDVDYDG